MLAHLERRGDLSRPLVWAAAALASAPVAMIFGDNAPTDHIPLLALHTVIELFSVCMAGLAFGALLAGSRRQSGGNDTIERDVLLGCAFLAAAVLDVGHALTFVGFPDLLTPNTTGKSVLFRVAAGASIAFALSMNAFFPAIRRRLQPADLRWMLPLTLLWIAASLWIGLWHSGWFPLDRPLRAANNLPSRLVDLAVGAVDLTAGLLLVRQAFRHRHPAVAWLSSAALTLALSEVFFSASDLSNTYWISAHLYKLLAYALVYRAVVYNAIEQPYRMLEHERTLFRTLYNALPDVVWFKDMAGTFRTSNRAHSDFIGLVEHEIVGKSAHEIFDADLAAMMKRREDRVLEKGFAHTEDLDAIDRQGRRRRIAATGIPTRSASGQLIGILNVARDVTEERQAGNRLKLMASVFENSHEGIAICDPDGMILDVNAAFTHITGYSREEAVGRIPPLNPREPVGDRLEVARALFEKGFWEGDRWGMRKNDERFLQRATVYGVRQPSGGFSHFVSVFSDITELHHHQEQLEHLAHFDALTALPNRAQLAQQMQQALGRARRECQLLAVCYLDLDHFKPINDRYGHAAGDRVLVEVSARMKRALRSSDNIARLGGDEFVLLLGDLDNEQHCQQAVTRIMQVLTEPLQIEDTSFDLSASIGVSLFPNDGTDPDQLLRQADQALYQAKQSGRNRYQLFDTEQHRRVRQRRDAVDRIAQALRDQEFRLYYEPRVDMRRGVALGAEALIRWQHPQLGVLSPMEFLPLIEDTELSAQVGNWVMNTAVAQLAQWWRDGLKLSVSINISGWHLQRDGFVDELRSALDHNPLAPADQLGIEILETAAIADLQRVSSIMSDCLQLGVAFALDDFGTGYSSLTYLRRLPAKTLKIDRTFVRDMLTDAEDCAIVEGIIGLARAFDRRVIAEGVESVAHGGALLRLGCTQAQGYGIARPMPADDLPAWIKNWQADPSWTSEAQGPRLGLASGAR